MISMKILENSHPVCCKFKERAAKIVCFGQCQSQKYDFDESKTEDTISASTPTIERRTSHKYVSMRNSRKILFMP